MTLANMREHLSRELLVYCLNPNCRRTAVLNVDDYDDDATGAVVWAANRGQFTAKQYNNPAPPTRWRLAGEQPGVLCE